MAQRRAWRSEWVWIPLIVVIFGVVLALFVYAERAKYVSDDKKARSINHPIPVRTALVTAGEVETVVGATTMTVAYDQYKLRIGPSRRLRERNPVVKAVLARDGTHVTPGQIVIELEPKEFEEQAVEKQKSVDAALAGLAQSQAELEQNALYRDVELRNAIEEVKYRTAAVEYTKEEYERLNQLFQKETAAVTERLNAATKYSEAEAELTKTRVREQKARNEIVVGPLRDEADLKKWTETLESARVDLALAEGDLEGCHIRACWEGYVTDMRVAPGQLVDDSTVMGVIVRADPITVQLDFPQERADELRVGQPVELVFDTFPKETFHGQVTRIPIHVDTPKRVVPVEVDLPNPQYRIKVGVAGYARVQISRQATSAPALSVIDLRSRAMALLVADGRAHMREVKTGPVLAPGVVEITAGLQPGDEVLVYGEQDVHDNERIDADWEHWTRRK